MKKILFLLAMLPMICLAQEPYTAYCQIVGTETFAGDVKVRIDFGVEGSKESKIVNENGVDVIFNSMMEAVNYVSKDGWEFVQTYAFQKGNSEVYHYMFKKVVTDDSQIKGNIITKQDIKKKKKK